MLYKTYENNAHMMGVADGDKAILTPIAHFIMNIQLEITIDENGNFHSARELEKAEGKTISPVNERSASRASGIAPHPLNDTLSYIARDYSIYVSGESEKNKALEKHAAYIEQLKIWNESEYTHPKVIAIYKYLSTSSVISDLNKAGFVKFNDSGELSDDKIKGSPYEKVFVRFRVLSEKIDDIMNAWEDATLWQKYISYYCSNESGNNDVCYIKGEKDVTSSNHPKGILASSYGAKLISANDSSGFTYRGRFIENDEALSISYEATQKAHAALTWLGANQSRTIGSKDKRTFICWCPQSKSVPEIDPAFGDDDNEIESISYTKSEYTDKLNMYIAGCQKRFEIGDDIVTISLEAATTGRLSVTYYNELKASDYINRIKNWRESCIWYFPYFNADKKFSYIISNPSTFRIAEYAFGDETDRGFIELKNDKLKREQTQRVLHCILDKQPVPRDIIRAIMKKASNPIAYSFVNYERVLSTACSLIAKYYNDKAEGVKFTMAIDVGFKDRSYIFGRLLAIAEIAEQKAMKTKFAKTGESDDRITNASRYMASYQNHPMYVYKIIRTKLQPYLKMLNPVTREYYASMFDEVFELIKTEDISELNNPLNEIYLLGYSHQRAALQDKDKDKII